MSTEAGATVRLWEALAGARPAARGAALLVALGAEPDFSAACERPLSACAATALDELRRRCGDTIDTVVACPDCATLLDVPVDLGRLAQVPAPTHALVGDVRVRAPTTGDLLLAGNSADPVATLRGLCVEEPGPAELPLPAEVHSAVEQLCGAAVVGVRAECPNCSATVRAELDLVDLLATGLADQAAAILDAVAQIAAAFGWPESDILALSPLRREYYLTLARTLRGRA